MPPSAIIRLGKLTWTTLWQVMMSQLAPPDRTGNYQRPASQFRDRVSSQPGARYQPATDRYQLIVGMSCPWAHRTVITRALKGLESAISVTIASPSETGLWQFDRPIAGCDRLIDLYQLARSGYQGRATVPVLWDHQTRSIVNNESSEIIEILNRDFNDFARHPDCDLEPADRAADIDRWNQIIYSTVNNGVYRCGFAQSQAAYDRACQDLFSTLDAIDAALADRPYLCGDRITLADVRLFTTLVRFDLVYYGLFKCNRRRIQDYGQLPGYLRRIYHLPGVAATCDLAQIKQDYYRSLFPLNPGGLVPAGPDLDWMTRP